jgi:ABC-type cobalamin/Fe3+-siderophores transport systems, ATPase components
VSDEINNQNVVEEAQDSPPLEEDRLVSLPLGDSLTSEETYNISSVEPSIFIVLAGPIGCGKTTLITSLYQMFLQKPIESYYFAGSQTLQAFEQRAYLSRVASGQIIPQTKRTPRGALNSFLHIRIWDSFQDKFENLLLTDFSGEDYSIVSANITLAKEEFAIVKAAQVIVMLIDGARISDNKYKHVEIQKAIHIIRTFYDAELINSKTRIFAAVSKYDIVHKKCKNDPELQDFIAGIPQKICKQVPGIESRMYFCYLAAMPNELGDISVGHGLKELLLDILISSDENYVGTSQPTVSPTTEFNLFNERA